MNLAARKQRQGRPVEPIGAVRIRRNTSRETRFRSIAERYGVVSLVEIVSPCALCGRDVDGVGIPVHYPVSMDGAQIQVLVVDDDPTVARLMALTLRSCGFLVCVASDGYQALDELPRCRPDVIVLDMQMPVMDGPTFYRHLRQQGWRAPVLIVSALSRAAVAREVDAQGYLAKPFLPDQLIAEVHTLAA